MVPPSCLVRAHELVERPNFVLARRPCESRDDDVVGSGRTGLGGRANQIIDLDKLGRGERELVGHGRRASTLHPHEAARRPVEHIREEPAPLAVGFCTAHFVMRGCTRTRVHLNRLFQVNALADGPDAKLLPLLRVLGVDHGHGEAAGGAQAERKAPLLVEWHHRGGLPVGQDEEDGEGRRSGDESASLDSFAPARAAAHAPPRPSVERVLHHDVVLGLHGHLQDARVARARRGHGLVPDGAWSAAAASVARDLDLFPRGGAALEGRDRPADDRVLLVGAVLRHVADPAEGQGLQKDREMVLLLLPRPGRWGALGGTGAQRRRVDDGLVERADIDRKWALSKTGVEEEPEQQFVGVGRPRVVAAGAPIRRRRILQQERVLEVGQGAERGHGVDELARGGLLPHPAKAADRGNRHEPLWIVGEHPDHPIGVPAGCDFLNGSMREGEKRL